MIKVSVIVPIYNAEKYLEQCLDSIVNQTLREIEIILIDDGSTDGSAEICKKYLDDERVIYHYKDNAGAVMARKDGVELAHGRYIGFVDSDDWVEATMYETMYNAAEEAAADIVFCNCIQNENDYYFSPEMDSGFYNRKEIETKILTKTLAYISDKGERRAIRWCNWLRIFKRDLMLGSLSYNPEIRRCEDLVMTYEATLKANSFVYLGDQYLYHNRVVQNSKSRRYTPDAWRAFKSLIEHLYGITEKLESPVMLEQMHLRAFFSTIDCLENEIKFYKQNKKDAIEQINRIMSDEIIDRYISCIPIEKMSKRYLVYHRLIRKKKPLALIWYERDRVFTEKVIKKKIRQFINFVSESKYTKNLYKLLRGN